MYKNRSGQTLVAVVALMIIALTIGITVSTRYIKSLRSFVHTDDSSKALAIAEAAVERLLVLPYETLENYVLYGSCGSNCSIGITDPNGQEIQANVVLSFAGNSADPYNLSLTTQEVAQVILTGYGSNSTLDVCWNGTNSLYANYIYQDGDAVKSDAYAYNAVASTNFDNDFDQAWANYGYENCFTVATIGTPRILRLKTFYLDGMVFVLPQAGQSLPSQGVYIESTGTAGDAVKTVTVLKTSATAPAFFDYVLYQKSTEHALSNEAF